MPIPIIGSAAYRALSFKEQLEIVSLKLFQPEEYSGESAAQDKHFDFGLEYPPLPPITVVDLPVSILRGYWAGYSCYFREKWYAGEYRGMTPLDDFGIGYSRMINIWTFTFPLLSLEAPMYYVFSWLLSRFSDFDVPHLLLRACKVYLYLETQLQQADKFESFKPYGMGSGGASPSTIVCESLEVYREIYNFTLLNFHCPIVEECHELTWFDSNELVLHPFARRKEGRYYYPLIPSGLFRTPHFKVTTWQFLK